MPYILKYKRPDGTILTAGAVTPFISRERAALQVLRIFVAEGVPISIGDAKRFGCLVRDAELSADVMHEPSGLTFKTVSDEEW